MGSTLVLRPAVGMRQYVGVPYVVALGVCDALPQAGIAWPYDVVDVSTGECVTRVRTRGGYDDEGMFAQVDIDLGPEVHEAIQDRVAWWAARASVAPLGAVLSEYADKLVQLNKEVRVCYPNGSAYAQGTFVGIDIWGRATVRLASGQSIEFPPEKFRMA
ncbi:MAG: hypothetical protein U0J70_01715 [Atopobiaceae bacterium]|nr:hypothetical protein [Atopobiaceae bacterium]